MRGVLSILAGALFLTSCMVNEHEVDPRPEPGPQEGMAEISFMADLPVPKVVATRAVGSELENAIEDIYVLVFKTTGSGDLVYKGKGRSLDIGAGAVNDNKITFKATLPIGTAYDFVVLANAEDYLDDISVSSGTSTKADVLDLVKTLATKWGVTSTTLDPIPMWGELKNTTLATTDSPTFSLARMLARVNVEYSPSSSSLDNFRLSSIYVYNYSTKGTLVPAASNWDSTEEIVTAPTAPDSGYGKPLSTARNPFIYTDITNFKKCADYIYLFEAAQNGSVYGPLATNDAWIENPCLVIGGKWSKDGGTTWPSTDSYYRVDFIKKTFNSQGEVISETWLPLLRNFSYNVTITEVSAEGYADPDVALRSAPLNVKANVLEWDEKNMEKIIFDGMYYLSVNKDEFVLQRNGSEALLADGSNAVKIKTDYLTDNDPTDVNSGWHVEKIEYVSGTGTDWLALSPSAKPSGWEPGDVNDAFFTFEDNPGPNNRTAVVWIKAGRLEYPVYVEQKILALDIEDKEGNDGVPIEEMIFDIRANGINVIPTPKDFWVKWNPIAEEVAIEMEDPRVGYGFLPTNLSPNPQTQGWEITTGTGKQKYTVSPPMVTDADLLTDAIYDKESIFWFEVENNGEIERKGINIHQIYYNIKVDTYGYRLDGGTYTMTVHSNTEWKITKIEEWLYNEDPSGPEYTYGDHQLIQNSSYMNLQVGTTGGPHRIGESVAFMSVDDMATRLKYGTVYVTFESTDDENPKFPPVTVPIVFSPESVSILTIGSTISNRAFNPGKSSTNHGYSAFDMFSNFRNFGDFDQSVVKTSPLEFHPHNWINWTNNPSGTSADNDTARLGDLKKWINLYHPMVIMVSYAVRLNTAESKLLIEYMNNGGVVILYYGCSLQEENVINLFFNELFKDQLGGVPFDISGTDSEFDYSTTANGQVAYMRSDLNHPILAGPFGNLNGKGFGFHQQRVAMNITRVASKVTSLMNVNDVLVKNNSAAWEDLLGTNSSYAWVHNDLPLLWVGNGYGFSTYFEEIAAEFYQDPLKVAPIIHSPMINTRYHPTGAYDDDPPYYYQDPEDGQWKYQGVYNSFFAANALAWALNKTAYKHPADDYATFGNGTYGN